MKKEFIRIIAKAGESPVCAEPDDIQSAIVGMPFSVDIVASDPDGMITGITAYLPLWAEFNIITKLPTPDLIARISGKPTSEDKGLHVMSVVVTDNDGNQAASTIKIKLVDYGFTDVQPGVSS